VTGVTSVEVDLASFESVTEEFVTVTDVEVDLHGDLGRLMVRSHDEDPKDSQRKWECVASVPFKKRVQGAMGKGETGVLCGGRSVI